jgi:hypothetical protein
MKFKLLLASLALFAGTAQANTISTTVLVDEPNDEVAYVYFSVTDAGNFTIDAAERVTRDGDIDPYIILFRAPVSNSTDIAYDDDGGSGDNSRISTFLSVNSYVLAVSTYLLTVEEAISGFNNAVDGDHDGLVDVTISSQNGTAQFGNPSAVPVPAAAWLFGSALLGFAGFRRKSV